MATIRDTNIIIALPGFDFFSIPVPPGSRAKTWLNIYAAPTGEIPLRRSGAEPAGCARSFCKLAGNTFRLKRKLQVTNQSLLVW